MAFPKIIATLARELEAERKNAGRQLKTGTREPNAKEVLSCDMGLGQATHAAPEAIQ